MTMAVHILCNNLSTRLPGIELARNTIICKDVWLYLPINMVCGHHSHAPCCEICLLDNLYHTNNELTPTKLLGVQPILGSDIVHV